VRAGVDVVSIDRLGRALQRTPALLDRVFTATEVRDAVRDGVAVTSPTAVARLAARFAAKEAARKAIGEPLGWHDVEVRTDSDGAPSLWLRGDAAPASLSLAHDAGVAVAFVVATKDP
jgi:holo-[acyl-carrier protein] synthase